MAEEKKTDLEDLSDSMADLSVRDKNIVAVLDDTLSTLKMIAREKSKFNQKMVANGYEVKTYLGTIPFFEDLENIKDRLALIISDFDMKDGGHGDDGDALLQQIRELGMDTPFIIVSNNAIQERGSEVEKMLNRLNASYINTGSSPTGKAGYYNSDAGLEEIFKKLRFKGKGLSTNSYNINSVSGRNMKYNSLREQILSLSQRRGLNTAMNQTLNEINQPRFYFK